MSHKSKIMIITLRILNLKTLKYYDEFRLYKNLTINNIKQEISIEKHIYLSRSQGKDTLGLSKKIFSQVIFTRENRVLHPSKG